MSEWKKYKLGALAEITSSKRIFLSDYTEAGIRFYRSTEIIQKSLGESLNNILYISEEKYFEIKRRFGVPIAGDFLISAVGNRSGIPYVVKDDGDFYFKDGNLIWFRNIDKNLFNIVYFYYWVKSDAGRNKIESLMIGSAQKALTIEGLKNLDVELPDYKIQERISSILSSLDDKIELNRKTNQTLEEIAQTLFKEMCLPNKDEMHDGWRMGKLIDGVELNPKLPLKKGQVTKYVEMKDLSETSYSIRGYIDREFKGGSKFQNGDTVLARITPCLENGKTGFIDFLNPSQVGWGSTEFIVMRGINGFGQYFVYCLSRFEVFREFAIRSMVGSSGRQRVAEPMLKDFDLAIPTEEVLKKFEKIVTPLFNQIKSNSDEIKTLSEIRDNLLPKLMKGEIEVK